MESDDNMNSRVASFACYLDTAKENLVHRVVAQETTPILLSSAKTISAATKPPFTISFSHSKEGLTNPGVDSFSYVTTSAENIAFEVPGPMQDPTSAFTFSHEVPKEGEISVFGADKYFNMQLECQTSVKHDCKNGGPLNLPLVGSNIRPRTLSLCSEENSTNTQTALLRNFQRSGSLISQTRAFGRSIFGGFGCRGPCFDKKSVYIKEIVPCYGSKPTRTGSQRSNQLAFLPVINPKTDNDTVEKQVEVGDIDESRHSIEVFGSRTALKGDVATKKERKLSMLTWDAIPKAQNLPTSIFGSGTICDDMASDASSDLFEIEHVSGSLHPVVTTEATDDMSSCLSPESHYAPSEASIQWSIVTASAADFPAFSDCNDESSVSIAGRFFSKINRSPNSGTGGAKEGQVTGRAGGLLGCKSHKSVDVAENLYHKANEKVKHKGLDLSASFGKFQGSVGRLQSTVTPKSQNHLLNGGGL